MPIPTLLVVDTDEKVRRSLCEHFSHAGYAVLEAATADLALKSLAAGVDLALLDGEFAGADGVPLFRRISSLAPDTPVIVMTEASTPTYAFDALQHLAYRYVRKPIDFNEISLIVPHALEAQTLRNELRAVRTHAAGISQSEPLIGTSPAITRVKSQLARMAASRASTVLLTGEIGTGKGLAARIIHEASDRAAKPFVHVTCGTLPEPQLEVELFGHERNAATGLHQLKRGLLEAADGGTVFVDALHGFAPRVQAKLLRFVEEKAFTRTGGSGDVRVNVRVIAVTNGVVETPVAATHHRDVLSYPLHGMPITMPALRDRAGDIPMLIEFYVSKYNSEFGKRVQGATTETEQLLTRYRWPGNVRELRNAIEHAMLLTDHAWLTVDDFPALARPAAASIVSLPADGVSLDGVEKQLLVQALERAGGNQTRAGRLLGINRDQVRYRIEKFGLRRQLVIRTVSHRASSRHAG